MLLQSVLDKGVVTTTPLCSSDSSACSRGVVTECYHYQQLLVIPTVTSPTSMFISLSNFLGSQVCPKLCKVDCTYVGDDSSDST